eukprot:14215-Heterococcus_DN1.PRE.2
MNQGTRVLNIKYFKTASAFRQRAHINRAMYNLHRVILHCDSHLSHGGNSMAVECLCCCAPPKQAAPQYYNCASPAAKHATLHHLACCGASEKQIHRKTTRKPAKPAQITM